MILCSITKNIYIYLEPWNLRMYSCKMQHVLKDPCHWLMLGLGDSDPSQQEADAESSNTVWVFAEASCRTHMRLPSLKDTAELMEQNVWMLKMKKISLATAHIFKICHIQKHDVPDFPEKSGAGERQSVRVVFTKSMSIAKKVLVWFLLLLTSTPLWHIFVCWGYRAVNMCSTGRLICTINY